mgnify:CR=1 FL=1
MDFFDEIKDIRKMLNTIDKNILKENFSYKRTDEEFLENVTYLSPKDTGLSKGILVDCGENYKYYNHPLCLYVISDNNVDVFPVTISNTPHTIKDFIIPSDIISFIQNSCSILKKLADMEISGGEFFDYVDAYKNTHQEFQLVGEMSRLSPQETGLPIWIYVDDTGSYMASGHSNSYRYKFQQDRSAKNPKLWMPVQVPLMKIMSNDTLPKCNISQKDIDKVLVWGDLNKDLLLQLKDNKITGREFKNSMVKFNKNGNTINVLLDSEIDNKQK